MILDLRASRTSGPAFHSAAFPALLSTDLLFRLLTNFLGGLRPACVFQGAHCIDDVLCSLSHGTVLRPVFRFDVNSATASPALWRTCECLAVLPYIEHALVQAQHCRALAQAVTTTSTTSPGLGMLSAPFRPACASPLQGVHQSVIFFHAMGTDAAIAHTTVTSRCHASDILSVLLWCMQCNQALPPQCHMLANARIYFDDAHRPHVFVQFRAQRAARHLWIFAPSWHPQPFGIPWDPQLELSTVLDAIGLSTSQVAIVSVDGEVRRGHPARAAPGSVVMVSPTTHGHFTLPLHLLNYRCPGLQALLFRARGPSRAQVADRDAVKDFCRAIIGRASDLLGEGLRGNMVVIASTSSPPLLCCVGTPLPPTLAQVQQFYNDRLATHFGQRRLCDTAQVAYDLCFFVERQEASDRRLWLLPLEGGADCHFGDIGGCSLAGVPTPRGFRLEPSVKAGWVGLSRLQPLTASQLPPVHDIVRIPPGLSSGSEDEAPARSSRALTPDESRLLARWTASNRRHAGEDVEGHHHAGEADVIFLDAEASSPPAVSTSSSSATSRAEEEDVTPLPDAASGVSEAHSLLQTKANFARALEDQPIRRVATPCRNAPGGCRHLATAAGFSSDRAGPGNCLQTDVAFVQAVVHTRVPFLLRLRLQLTTRQSPKPCERLGAAKPPAHSYLCVLRLPKACTFFSDMLTPRFSQFSCASDVSSLCIWRSACTSAGESRPHLLWEGAQAHRGTF